MFYLLARGALEVTPIGNLFELVIVKSQCLVDAHSLANLRCLVQTRCHLERAWLEGEGKVDRKIGSEKAVWPTLNETDARSLKLSEMICELNGLRQKVDFKCVFHKLK